MSRAHGHSRAWPIAVACPECGAVVGQNCLMAGAFSKVFHDARQSRARDLRDLVDERERVPPKKPVRWVTVDAAARRLIANPALTQAELRKLGS